MPPSSPPPPPPRPSHPLGALLAFREQVLGKLVRITRAGLMRAASDTIDQVRDGGARVLSDLDKIAETLEEPPSPRKKRR